MKKYDDIESWVIDQIEEIINTDREQARLKEGVYIRNLKPALNSKIEGRSRKEWYDYN